MDRKYKIPFALTILTLALVGCSSNKIKVEDAKPSPLPKLELWSKKVSKQGLSSGVEAKDGLVIVGNHKGQLFALDQATGEQKWTAQLTGAILAPSLVQSGRVVTVSNDGTVFAHDLESGQQVWSYDLPSVQFSLRGTSTPIALDARLDARTVLVSSANAYVYALDVLSGVPRMQRRVAVSDGRSDIQRLNDVDGDPVVAGQLLVTTSFQGQVTATDLASQQVIWSEDASSTKRPEVADNKVFVAQADGKLTAYDLATGQQLWQNEQLLNRELSNPVLFGQDLVVGDLDGVYLAFGRIVNFRLPYVKLSQIRIFKHGVFEKFQCPVFYLVLFLNIFHFSDVQTSLTG